MIHFGIDFGTANTRVSLYDGPGLPKSLPIGRSGTSPYMMPSACWVDNNGDVIVGEHALAQPARLKFIKRYWQDRKEDRDRNPWPGGRREISGKLFTCEEMVEQVIAEALARAREEVGKTALRDGFTANIVCPVEFNLCQRSKLSDILVKRGARAASLSSVIDEPLAAAVLYGRLETIPPTKLDILIFDAGAGTVDSAVVRFKENEDGKQITVLAEQGRCWAGSDFDRIMENFIAEKLAGYAEGHERSALYRAYGLGDLASGQLIFENECEQIKQELANRESFLWRKADFLGQPEIQFLVTRDEFNSRCRSVLNQMEALVKSVLKEAVTCVEDFEGINLVVMIGGTSKLPAVRDIVMKHCPRAKVVSNGVLDEMLATALGVGFTKDFKDLVLKRPPYTTDVRVTLADGSHHLLRVNEAFEPFDWTRSYSTIPFHEVKRQFTSPIDTIDVSFTSPGNEVLNPGKSELPPDIVSGSFDFVARLNLRGYLSVGKTMVKAPYFSQVGLKASKPYNRRQLSAPEVYPDDN